MKSTFIYSTRVFHMPNVQKAILVKDTNYNKKLFQFIIRLDI